MKAALFALLATLAAWAPAQVNQDENPGSLWPARYTSPLLDRTARREGDLVTILISETSAASFAATTSTSKSDQTSIPQINIPFLKSLFPSLGIGASSSSSGQGQSSQTGSFRARMTAVVKKVLPNGNLVIEGGRWVKVNKEVQTFKLSGIIRRDDVRSDNTILSEMIAEAQITSEGKGAIADRQRRGILTRLLDWLF